ncbi:MAG: hypothetical protein WA634_13180, partial [Silvibacterium sp.]
MLEPTENRLSPATVHRMEYRAIVAAGLASSQPVTDAPPPPDPEELAARIRELELELEERARSFESAMQAARLEA